MKTSEIRRKLKKISAQARPDKEWLEKDRRRLAQFMRMHPVIDRGEQPAGRYFGRRFFSGAFAAFLLLVFLGGGIATLASQNSLPGDRLYGIKIISERTAIKMPFVPVEQKTKLGIEFAERRIKELEELKEKDRLSDNAVREGMKNYSEMVGVIEAKIDEKGKNDPTGALKMVLEAESRLDVHKEKINRLSDDDLAEQQEEKIEGVGDRAFKMELEMNIVSPVKINGHSAKGAKSRIEEKINFSRKEAEKLLEKEGDDDPDGEKELKEDIEAIKEVEEMVEGSDYRKAFDEAKKIEKKIKNKRERRDR